MLKNLLDIKDLNKSQITEIIELASLFEHKKAKSSVEGKNLALIFCENSTRTRLSFEMAAFNLNLRVFNFDADKSSFSKGETLKDTLQNLCAIGIDVAVIRHSENGIMQKTLADMSCDMKLINAGEGNISHPTQALLDFYTIKKHLGDVAGKNILFVGDISHSRVTRSNIELLEKFGAKITLCSPNCFKSDEFSHIEWSDNLEKCLKSADVAMFLRVQHERHDNHCNGQISLKNYSENFGLNLNKYNKYCKKSTLIMHPGPVNRGVELDSDILDSDVGKTILEQAKNGVFVRMAVLELILNNVEIRGQEVG